MIPLLLIAVTSLGQADDAIRRDETYCSSSASDEPLRFCLAGRLHERANSELAALLVKARRAAKEQRQEIARFSSQNGGVTFIGDPVTALEQAQKAWEVSYEADCAVFALSRATGNAGTEGVTADLECRADRLVERRRFLKTHYDLKD